MAHRAKAVHSTSPEVGSAGAPRSASAWGWGIAAAVVTAATVLAYSNSFRVPLLFDDTRAISSNPTIRQLWPPWLALSPPHQGSPVDGRPVLNVSFALNYATSGVEVWSYHAVNLAIHVMAAMVLLGVIRRTLLLPTVPEGIARNATALAGAAALIWAVHPLQTESVTYLSQRAESLVSLFYLLTLYGTILAATATRPGPWYAVSVAACSLGMASKEVMASAPLIVLLYDRTFLAGSFREAWKRRWGLYVALAATWILLAALVIGSGGRNRTVGFHLTVSPWEYALTQCGAIVRYLRLSFWPSGLCVDYGDAIAPNLRAVLPEALAVAALALLAILALWRWPVAGFLGAFSLAVLAPTSSIVPVVTQTVAEHRMYLALAALATGVVVGGYLIGRRVAGGAVWFLGPATLRAISFALVGLVAAGLGMTTFLRNRDYRDELSLWTDTVRKCPENLRARSNLVVLHNGLGMALERRGKIDAAIAQYRRAIEVKSDYPDAHHNLAKALLGRGQVDEAVGEFRRTLESDPSNVEVYTSLGAALAERGNLDEAIVCLCQALRMHPRYKAAARHLDRVLDARSKQLAAQLVRLRTSLRANPNDVALLNDTARILATSTVASLRNGPEALELARRAAKLSSGKGSMILDTLAAAYAEVGQFAEAAKAAREAAELAARRKDAPMAAVLRARAKVYEGNQTPFPTAPPPLSLFSDEQTAK
jgi:protein O-mannosyl-transferase